MSRKMPDEIFATPSLDELVRQLRQGSAEPESRAAECASRTTDPAGGSNTLAEMSGMFSDTGNERLVPGLVPGASLPTPAPSRRNMAAGLPVGILLYLVSVGLVAIATIGVFFGIAFFLLAQPKEELITGSGTRDRDTKTEMPRSAAAAALPVSPLAQRPAVGEAVPQQESNSARGSVPVSPDGEASASAARGAMPSGEVLALRSTSGEATIIAPAQTASAPEPEPSSPASPAPPPASPRVFAAEIAEVLAAPRAPVAGAIVAIGHRSLVGAAECAGEPDVDAAAGVMGGIEAHLHRGPAFPRQVAPADLGAHHHGRLGARCAGGYLRAEAHVLAERPRLDLEERAGVA